MRMDKLTSRFQQALADAQSLAVAGELDDHGLVGGAGGGSVLGEIELGGETREAGGLLLYPNPTLDRAAIQAAVRAGLDAFNARAKGSGGRVARALVLPDTPDVHAGEITDKGYIAQSLARARRAEAIDRLFADPAPSDVMVF